jgi:GDP-mannose 6-dehydrogenase
MRVSVFGLGYVGSVTATCLARAGHEVTGADKNAEKVDMINRGVPPVVEPGLEEALTEARRSGRLNATTSTDEAIAKSDLALVCVGTPGRKSGQLDVAAIERVAEEIGAALRDRREPYTVILRSTVLPGTCERVFAPAIRMRARHLGSRLRICVNPEFMREGSSLADFATPPFTLIGCDDAAAATLVRVLYNGVRAPFVETSIRTAEMVKYVTNAYHALKICFANEIGDVCESVGADPQEVMRIFALDKKLNISEAYLKPGFAFGGSCLPKDVRALLYAARANDIESPLLTSIIPSNVRQVQRALDKVVATGKKRIGVLGLAFKAKTDDLRESPLVTLVEQLIGKGYDVRVYDKNVSLAKLIGANREYIEQQLPHVASLLTDDLEQVLEHAEALVIGNGDEDATRALTLVRRDQPVIDLTRGLARGDLDEDTELVA